MSGGDVEMGKTRTDCYIYSDTCGEYFKKIEIIVKDIFLNIVFIASNNNNSDHSLT